MTRKSILTTAAALMIAAGAYSQTLQSAQNMVKEGNYAEAKDFFERRVKAAPSNAANNYWYGVCCAHTGEEAKAVKYLQNAVKRKYKDAYPELTDVYMRLYRFDEAADTASDYTDLLKKGKDNDETAKAERLERAASERKKDSSAGLCSLDTSGEARRTAPRDLREWEGLRNSTGQEEPTD